MLIYKELQNTFRNIFTGLWTFHYTFLFLFNCVQYSGQLSTQFVLIYFRLPLFLTTSKHSAFTSLDSTIIIRGCNTAIHKRMVTTKIWKSLETISGLVPRGIFDFTIDFPSKLQKTNQFSHRAYPYLIFFILNATSIPICNLVKLLTTSLPLHLYAIHIAMLVIITCAIILCFVLLYTVFGNEDVFFLHFNRITTFQIKSLLGKYSCL